MQEARTLKASYESVDFTIIKDSKTQMVTSCRVCEPHREMRLHRDIPFRAHSICDSHVQSQHRGPFNQVYASPLSVLSNLGPDNFRGRR